MTKCVTGEILQRVLLCLLKTGTFALQTGKILPSKSLPKFKSLKRSLIIALSCCGSPLSSAGPDAITMSANASAADAVTTLKYSTAGSAGDRLTSHPRPSRPIWNRQSCLNKAAMGVSYTRSRGLVFTEQKGNCLKFRHHNLYARLTEGRAMAAIVALAAAALAFLSLLKLNHMKSLERSLCHACPSRLAGSAVFPSANFRLGELLRQGQVCQRIMTCCRRVSSYLSAQGCGHTNCTHMRFDVAV